MRGQSWLKRSAVALVTICLVLASTSGGLAQRIPIGPPLGPPRVLNPTDLVAITAGDFHTCAVQWSGAVFCWGANDLGQLGTGGSLSTCGGKACEDKPVQIKNFQAVQIDAGGSQTCSLNGHGVASCWGDNTFGQVGTSAGGFTSFLSPQPVSGGLVFNSISAGENSTCGFSPIQLFGQTTTGLFCWGLIVNGKSSTPMPVLLDSSNDYSVLSVGNGHICSVFASGSMRQVGCGGMNNFGQLGVDPTTLPSAPPALAVVSSLGMSAVRVSSAGGPFGVGGGFAYTCADQTSGVVQCVGNNQTGQLGNGTVSFNATFTPQTVGSGSLHGVMTGMTHACALDPSNLAYCWGSGWLGELGNGWVGTFATPQAVIGGPAAFRALAAGQQHTCGIGTDNHIYCWGDNTFGQIGIGFAGQHFSAPQQVM